MKTLGMRVALPWSLYEVLTSVLLAALLSSFAVGVLRWALAGGLTG
jgi:hypothetical protein